MSKPIQQMPLVPPVSPQRGSSTASEAADSTPKTEKTALLGTDHAELSAPARLRLGSAVGHSFIEREEAYSLAREVADMLHEATHSGAVHRVAAGALGRLIR
ncbi:MAG: hypothetical protein AB8H79_22685 [Myxococcota bacterium]